MTLKKTTTIWIIFLLIPTYNTLLAQEPTNPFYYSPTEANLLDNAYNTTDYFSLQWWYIDAMFDNNYSIHIGMSTIGARGKYGFFLFQINIYHQGKIIEKKFKIEPLRNIQASTTKPHMILKENTIFQGYINQQGNMKLNITLEIKGIAVNLTFNGTTKGWVGYTGLGMWGCPIPKAIVQGTITILGNETIVQGTGYQEHGWDIRRLHRSWYWGKFITENYNVIFSKNMKNRWEEDVFLVVVNDGEENYTSLFRENISLEHCEYVFDHAHFIPVHSIFRAQHL